MNNGGPAFPELISIDAEASQPAGGEARYYVDTASGMSLRDWFAGMALQGILSKYTLTSAGDGAFLARVAFSMADSMLKEREK